MPLDSTTDREFFRVSLEHPLEVELLDLPLQATGQTRQHGGAAGQHDVLVQVSADVDVSRLDRVEEQLCGPDAVHVDEVRLEEGLWSLEALPTHLDDTAVWQLQRQRTCLLPGDSFIELRKFTHNYWL